MSEAYIIDAIRTPIGKYRGSLSPIRADDLAALPIKELINRNPDIDPERIEEAKKFGFQVFYGDGRRRDILMAAGIKKVQAVMVVTDNKTTTSSIIDIVKDKNPNAKIYARSYDRIHSVELYKKDIDYSMRETFESALILSQRALQGMGIDEEKARTVVTEIRKRDRNRLKEQVKGDVYSGKQHILNKPIKPEPLK